MGLFFTRIRELNTAQVNTQYYKKNLQSDMVKITTNTFKHNNDAIVCQPLNRSQHINSGIAGKWCTGSPRKYETWRLIYS